MACKSKLRPELLRRKKQYFNVSGLVNAIGRHKGRIRSLTTNLNQNVPLGPNLSQRCGDVVIGLQKYSTDIQMKLFFSIFGFSKEQAQSFVELKK